jgi:phosphoribosylformimino-5-aminoimidazole carboxamide ribotide isomerase
MLLIIPTIPVLHGACGDCISTSPNHTKEEEERIYSSDPSDRARLLRKENAKLLHLSFLDDDPWSERSSSVIDDVRAAVDIPFELSLATIPDDHRNIGHLLEHGIYRLFFPLGAEDEEIFEYAGELGARRMVPTAPIDLDFEQVLPRYRANSIERVGLEISPDDKVDTPTIDWERLEAVIQVAKENRVRITAMHGVRNYPDLRQLQDTAKANPGVLDSLVLNRALNENRFPCQMIWRELEADFATEESPSANLWTNPLAGKPHI